MSDYTSTFSKITGNTVEASDFSTEFDAIEVSSATKADKSGDTLTTTTLTSPKINEVLDTNGNELLKFTTTASAVNEVTLANAATGNNPALTASGEDVGIDIEGVSFKNGATEGLFKRSVTTGITAFAGGGQANAVELTTDINVIGTVASANDSVKLPTAVAGYVVRVINIAANNLALFPSSGDDLGAGVDTSRVVTNGTTFTYYCYDGTTWVEE